jgi:hypothetical protein
MPVKNFLSHVLVDERNNNYPKGLDKKSLRDLGIQVIDAPLISESSRPYIDPALLLPVMLSLA